MSALSTEVTMNEPNFCNFQERHKAPKEKREKTHIRGLITTIFTEAFTLPARSPNFYPQMA